jgi:hypothetical protein
VVVFLIGFSFQLIFRLEQSFLIIDYPVIAYNLVLDLGNRSIDVEIPSTVQASADQVPLASPDPDIISLIAPMVGDHDGIYTPAGGTGYF